MIDKKGNCYEIRGLGKSQKNDLLEGKSNTIAKERILTAYLNNWDPIKQLLK